MKMRIAMKVLGSWSGRHRRQTMQAAWRRFGYDYESQRAFVDDLWKQGKTTHHMARRFALAPIPEQVGEGSTLLLGEEK